MNGVFTSADGSAIPHEFVQAVHDLRAKWPQAPSRYRLPLTSDTFGDEEVAAALEALVRGPVTLGPRVAAFERVFAKAFGAADAVFCNSGSSANLLALAALARRQGLDGAGNSKPPLLLPADEVIVPAVTWSTTLWPVAQVGAVPVLADVDPATLNLTVASIEQAISAKTRAVFVAHILGNPAPMQQIRELCRQRDLILLEDVCESLDAEIGGEKCGTFGRFGTFSFYFSHHICTTEGGMVLCRTAEDGELLRIQRAHGWTRNLTPQGKSRYEKANPHVDPRFLFIDTGYNLRPTDIQAAIGLVQFGRRKVFLQHRRAVAVAWMKVRDELSDVFLPMHFDAGASHFAFPLVLQPGVAKTRQDLADFLESHGVENRPLVAGNLSRQPALQHVAHRVAGDLQGANILHERAMYVGIHPNQSGDDLAYLGDVLNKFAILAR